MHTVGGGGCKTTLARLHVYIIIYILLLLGGGVIIILLKLYEFVNSSSGIFLTTATSY